MEDPFASLTGNAESEKPKNTVSGSPFSELVVGSKRSRLRNRSIYSLGIVVILLLGVWFVPRALSGDSATSQVSTPESNVASPPVEIDEEAIDLDPVTQPTISEEDISSDSGISDDIDMDPFDAPTDLNKFIEGVTASTVIIECAISADAEEASYGSGFVSALEGLFIESESDSFIVTNYHVVEDCVDGGGVLFVGSGEEYFETQVLDYDVANDLAIIESIGLPFPPIEVSRDIVLGQWVMTSGSPINIESNVTFGQITSLQVASDTGGADAVASDAVIGPGNSGGPLVDNQGRVVAVNSAIFIDVTGLSVSVPIKHLCIEILRCE